MQQPINPNRDREMTDYLYNALLRLPGEIGGIEAADAATMTEARQGIAASSDAMTQDFSVANDAALFAADQYDDWRDWQWSIGDLGL